MELIGMEYVIAEMMIKTQKTVVKRKDISKLSLLLNKTAREFRKDIVFSSSRHSLHDSLSDYSDFFSCVYYENALYEIRLKENKTISQLKTEFSNRLSKDILGIIHKAMLEMGFYYEEE